MSAPGPWFQQTSIKLKLINSKTIEFWGGGGGCRAGREGRYVKQISDKYSGPYAGLFVSLHMPPVAWGLLGSSVQAGLLWVYMPRVVMIGDRGSRDFSEVSDKDSYVQVDRASYHLLTA